MNNKEDYRMKNHRTIVAFLTAAGLVASAAAQTTHHVDVGPGTSFAPADIVIEVGDTVRWTWVSGFHNVESGVGGTHDEIFRSGDPTSAPGTEFEVLFDQTFVDDNPVPDDVYDYYCIAHVGLGMVGTVEVVTCPADLDGDGQIGLGDLAQLLANYGTASGAGYFDGDLDFDGAVELADLAKLLSLYDTACD